MKVHAACCPSPHPKSPFTISPPQCCLLFLRHLSYSYSTRVQTSSLAQLPNKWCSDTSPSSASPFLPGGLPGKARGSACGHHILQAGIMLGSHPALEGSRWSRGQWAALLIKESIGFYNAFSVFLTVWWCQQRWRKQEHAAFWGIWRPAALLGQHRTGMVPSAAGTSSTGQHMLLHTQYTSQDTSLPTTSSALLLYPCPNRPGSIQLQLLAKAGL